MLKMPAVQIPLNHSMPRASVLKKCCVCRHRLACVHQTAGELVVRTQTFDVRKQISVRAPQLTVAIGAGVVDLGSLAAACYFEWSGWSGQKAGWGLG